MFVRKTIAILLIAGGILGLLLTVWEFRYGSWFLAATGSDIPYGQFLMLGIMSLASLIGGIYLYSHRMRMFKKRYKPHKRRHRR